MLEKLTYLSLAVLTIILQTTNSFSQSKENSKLKLLTYGLPDFEKQDAENIIADKWGIEFYPVAGCMVATELLDSVEKQNKPTELLIKKKYGNNWRDKFYAEVDEEFKLEKKIKILVGKLDYVKKTEIALERDSSEVHYLMTPIAKTNKYNVHVQGWSNRNRNSKWVTYYKLLVDYKTNLIQLVNDKVVKE